MFDSMKNDKGKIITLIGMAVMLIAVAVKAATSSISIVIRNADRRCGGCQRHDGQRLFAGKGRCQSPQ